jgi:hypothetical protein
MQNQTKPETQNTKQQPKTISTAKMRELHLIGCPVPIGYIVVD